MGIGDSNRGEISVVGKGDCERKWQKLARGQGDIVMGERQEAEKK